MLQDVKRQQQQRIEILRYIRKFGVINGMMIKPIIPFSIQGMNTKTKTWADIQAEAKAAVDAKHAQEQALKDAVPEVPENEGYFQKTWRILKSGGEQDASIRALRQALNMSERGTPTPEQIAIWNKLTPKQQAELLAEQEQERRKRERDDMFAGVYPGYHLGGSIIGDDD